MLVIRFRFRAFALKWRKQDRTYDVEVQEYIKNLQLAGGIVNRHIFFTAARGILMAIDRQLLNECWGSMGLSNS